MGGTNITKKHRENLSAKIDHVAAFLNSIDQSPEQQRVLADLYSVKTELNGKRYGLRFEEHREQLDDLLEKSVPVLVEEEDLKLLHGGEMNFLIEGDNLAALELLCRTHTGRIDLIYIDPPYNTGSTKERFKYDDDIVDKNDLFRHSKWLSFMDRRLRKAKKLLSSKGSIFISINDVEQAPLKMLCDDIFGPDCFQGCICWQKTYSPRNDKNGIPAECEYILVYSRLSDWKPKKLGRTSEMDSRYKSPDGDSRLWKSADASAPGSADHQGMVYAIQSPFTGSFMYPPNGRHWTLGQEDMLDIMNGWCRYELRNLDDAAQRSEVCGIAESEVRKNVAGIVLVDSLEESQKSARIVYERGSWPLLYFTSGGFGSVQKKTYLDSVDGKLPTTFWPFIEVGHNDGAKKELQRVFGGKTPFETPKPTRLIERILDIASDSDSIVLDFFAGSATTAHAVLQHNYEHNGHRRFILCTNNESGICRNVAYERIRRVTEGYSFKGKLTKTVFDEEITTKLVKSPEKMKQLSEDAERARARAEEKHGKARLKMDAGHVKVEVEDTYDGWVDPIPGSLKYLKVDFVSYTEEDAYETGEVVLEHVRELVELENGIDFSTDGTAAIALTDEELDELIDNLDKECRVVYVGHDVLIPSNVLDLFQKRLIMVNVIPEYYYRELEV